jgi:hypothetical protein
MWSRAREDHSLPTSTPPPNPLRVLIIGALKQTLSGLGEEAGAIRPWPPPQNSPYSTVTLLARLRGWSTSVPRRSAMW